LGSNAEALPRIEILSALVYPDYKGCIMPVRIKGESKVLPKKRQKLQEPRDYKVVLLNDNYTTKEFVVEILKQVFHKNSEEANRIMLNVHQKGRGVVGIYCWDIANTKAGQVHAIARQYEYPLRCMVEEA
jgi:ATP-dependent Clp protease adaptor protein ClpS